MSHCIAAQATWIVEPTKGNKRPKYVGEFIIVKDGDNVRIVDTLGVQAYYPKDSIMPDKLFDVDGEIMLSVKKDNLIGLQTMTGENILPIVYEDIKPLTKHFYEVTKYYTTALVNDKNNLVSPYNKHYRPTIISDSIVEVLSNGKNIYYHVDGDTLDHTYIKNLTSKYKSADVSYIRNADKLWGVVKNETDTIIPYRYNDITQIGPDLFLCQEGKAYGIISKDEIIIPIEYKDAQIKTLGERLVVDFSFSRNHKRLVFFPDTKRTFGENAEQIYFKDKNKIALSPDANITSQRNVFSKDLKPLITVDDTFEFLDKDLIAKYKDGRSIVINSVGDKIFETEGTVKKASESLLLLEKDTLYGLLSKTGKVILPTKYKSLTFDRGVFKAWSPGDKIEHYTAKGVLIPYESSRLRKIDQTPFYTTDGLIINEKGKVVFDEQFYTVSVLSYYNSSLLEVYGKRGVGVLRVVME